MLSYLVNIIRHYVYCMCVLQKSLDGVCAGPMADVERVLSVVTEHNVL